MATNIIPPTPPPPPEKEIIPPTPPPARVPKTDPPPPDEPGETDPVTAPESGRAPRSRRAEAISETFPLVILDIRQQHTPASYTCLESYTM